MSQPEPIELAVRLAARAARDRRSTAIYVTLTCIFSALCLAVITFSQVAP